MPVYRGVVLAHLWSLRQSVSPSDHGLGTGGGGARGQLPVNGGSLAPGPETGTGATGAVPAATAEVTGGGPETGVQNTSTYSLHKCFSAKGSPWHHREPPLILRVSRSLTGFSS